MKALVLAGLIAASSVIPAMAAPAAPATHSQEATIPFVNHGGINDWRENGRDSLYIQDQHRQWYLARLMGPCTDLPFAEAIGFETRGADTLDRYSSIIVKGHRCALSSLVKSAPPPKGKSGRKHGIDHHPAQAGHKG